MIIQARWDVPATPATMPRIIGLPNSEDFAGITRWQFLSKTGYLCDIPGGFICDLDSIPRLPVIHAMFKGRSVAGVYAHDFEYSLDGQLSQKEADALMLEIGYWEGTSAKYMRPMYRGVRVAGKTHYRKKEARYLDLTVFCQNNPGEFCVR